ASAGGVTGTDAGPGNSGFGQGVAAATAAADSAATAAAPGGSTGGNAGGVAGGGPGGAAAAAAALAAMHANGNLGGIGAANPGQLASILGVVKALLGQQQAGQQGPQAFGNLGVPPGLLSGVSTANSPVTTSPLGPPSLNPAVIAALNAQLGQRGGQSAPGGLGGINAQNPGQLASILGVAGQTMG